MKKIAPKEISQKVGRTPTGKSINNISLMNKRGVSSEEQNNKSLYKNYLEYKKSIPHLDKTISKLIITEIANDKTKENNNSFLNKKALVATSSISNLNSILNNINCFDILEKIFVFIKPKIPFDLFTEFKRFINEEFNKIEAGSVNTNLLLNSSLSSINEILSTGISRNLNIFDENTESKKILSSKLNMKLMNNLNKNGIIKTIGNSCNYISEDDKRITFSAKQQEPKSSNDCKIISSSKATAYKDFAVNYKINNIPKKINSNNSKCNLKTSLNDQKSLNSSLQKNLSQIKDQSKVIKNPKVNEISINLNDIMSLKNDHDSNPKTVKVSSSIIKNSNTKEQKKSMEVKSYKCDQVNNHEMLNEIKMKIDDNLKHLFNFSYDNFHSKEVNESIVSKFESLND